MESGERRSVGAKMRERLSADILFNFACSVTLISTKDDRKTVIGKKVE